METKKHKPTNHNPKRNKAAKVGGIYGQLKDSMSWREIKPDIKFIRKLIDHLQEWIENPKHTDMYSFFHYLGIPSTTYYRWCDKFAELHDAHAIAIEVLGVRRSSHAEYKEYGANPEVIKSTLYKYHPVWKEVHEEEKAFKRDLKKIDDIENTRPIQVFMDGISVTKDKE